MKWLGTGRRDDNVTNSASSRSMKIVKTVIERRGGKLNHKLSHSRQPGAMFRIRPENYLYKNNQNQRWKTTFEWKMNEGNRVKG